MISLSPHSDAKTGERTGGKSLRVRSPLCREISSAAIPLRDSAKALLLCRMSSLFALEATQLAPKRREPV
ncbi:hypothetical protein IE81DRAFT_319630 [Ceraceosorus guamensis]|uniref:Uncharacterized protein n=1 Tax=Ceraceosorus guamensis TaxID=1522189 RepID=A0A316W774_9BASI|nr:hypothetical protein IE81DRAFT_319630 [Ceraceosorus guamensis]PWN45796.1 hypothetical protein IE81DRAFT_319630 [Ceraceosorus guamensis]